MEYPGLSRVSQSTPDLVARLALMEGVGEEPLARALAAARWIEADPDETIIDLQDALTDVYFILQGSLRVSVQTADSERIQILGDFNAGDLMGEMAAIDAEPRSARVETLVRTRLCIITAPAFLDLVFSSRAIGLRLMQMLTKRIRRQNRQILEYAALPIGKRLAAELLRLSRPRPDGTRLLSPPPTQEKLAARIGSRRESVSRELAKLISVGLVTHTRAAIVLHDPVALRGGLE